MERLQKEQLSAGLNPWKKTVMVGLSALVLSGGIVAAPAWADGDKKDRGHNPAARLEKMTKKLSLTEAQQAKIRPILEEKAEKMKALHEQMREMRQQSIARIEAELTEDQKAKFKEMREKYKKKKHDRHKKGGKKKGHHSDDHD